MNYAESLDYIYNAKQAGAVKNGLVNITELLHRLGNPETLFRSVHVAGTNGKGSVCAFMESMLRAAGYRTGLFTSPYLERFTERIRIGEQEIPQEEFAEIATEVRVAADSMVAEGLTHPTFFELVSACCFLYFANKNIDVAIVEAGLGGRTDATNVLTPLLSVITTIGIDHAHALGSTIELIAGEKAGIIKRGVPCVLSAANVPQATYVIIEAAERAFSTLILGADYLIETVRDSLDGQMFNLNGSDIDLSELEISLLGSHQLINATTAILAIFELNKQGFEISDAALRQGLKCTSWPGRMELLQREPPFLIDGAHNPQAAEKLADNVLHYLTDRSVLLVTGVMADKDAEQIVQQFSRFASKVIATVPPAHGRQQCDAVKLAGLFKSCGVEALACADWREALACAVESQMAVVVAGSLYLAGAARTYLQFSSAEASSVGAGLSDASALDSIVVAVATTVPEGSGVPDGDRLITG